MKDEEKIFNELKSRAIEPESEKELIEICKKLLQTFKIKSKRGVVESINFEMKAIRETYKEAYKKVMEKIGQ
jgi:hypothetical protein